MTNATVDNRPAYQAFQILRAGFTAAPVLAGADKFFHLLCNWDQYLAPWIAKSEPRWLPRGSAGSS
jgi:hypothetical protein